MVVARQWGQPSQPLWPGLHLLSLSLPGVVASAYNSRAWESEAEVIVGLRPTKPNENKQTKSATGGWGESIVFKDYVTRNVALDCI